MAANAAKNAAEASTRRWAAAMDDGQRGEISEMNQWRGAPRAPDDRAEHRQVHAPGERRVAAARRYRDYEVGPSSRTFSTCDERVAELRRSSRPRGRRRGARTTRARRCGSGRRRRRRGCRAPARSRHAQPGHHRHAEVGEDLLLVAAARRPTRPCGRTGPRLRRRCACAAARVSSRKPWMRAQPRRPWCRRRRRRRRRARRSVPTTTISSRS